MKGRLPLFSLGAKLLLLTAALVTVTVGAAVALVFFAGGATTSPMTEEIALQGATAQTTFQLQRFDQLSLAAQLLATDARWGQFFPAADDEVEEVPNLQVFLEQQQGSLGLDFSILVDPGGLIYARSDEANPLSEDLSNEGLVRDALSGKESHGFRVERGQLQLAAAAPIAVPGVPLGAVITGYAVTRSTALEVRVASGAESAFVLPGPAVSATSLGGGEADLLPGVLDRQTDALSEVLDQSREVSDLSLSLGKTTFLSHLKPLSDSSGDTVAAALVMAPVAGDAAAPTALLGTLLAVGLGALAVGSLLALQISRSTSKPVRRLASAVEGALKGGSQRKKLPSGGSGAIGRLTESVSSLLRELDERAALESYMSSASRLSSRAEGGGDGTQSEVLQLALLGVELRRFAHPWVAKHPEETLKKLEAELRMAAQVVDSHSGQTEEVSGQRLLASFGGSEQTLHALRAAASALATLDSRRSAFDEGDPPAAAVVFGKVVIGSTRWSGASQPALVGLLVQQMESLLREAAPGDILLSAQAHRAVEEELKGQGIELVAQRGMATTQPIFRVPRKAFETDAVAAPAEHTKGLKAGRELGGRFELLILAGEDRQGQRFEARDRELDGVILLDLLRPELWPEASHLELLKQEADAAGQVIHPNVQRVVGAGSIDGYPYIARELVGGATLRSLVEACGAPLVPAGLRIARQLCGGVAAAHDAGVSHRDLTPEAARVDASGILKITGFGVTRPRLTEDTGGTMMAGSAPAEAQYLAPEQREGREGDERSDVFACGLILYELFTGKRPFPPGSFGAELEDIAPPRSVAPSLPDTIDKMILRCLERKPERRFASGKELADALYRVRS